MSAIARSRTTLQYNEGITTNSKATSVVNNTNDFMLVIGLGMVAALTTDGDSVQVINAQGNAINTMALVHFGTAASEFLLYFPKNLLIPPGGWLRTTHNSFCQFVSGNLYDLVAGL